MKVKEEVTANGAGRLRPKRPVALVGSRAGMRNLLETWYERGSLVDL